ncbi:MAG: hypothetical protein EOO17_06190 [Chloroflexi bacterium]|nr:MAG: hypothetical protein EOO17_06190 [Chloroflexota bacterium]
MSKQNVRLLLWSFVTMSLVGFAAFLAVQLMGMEYGRFVPTALLIFLVSTAVAALCVFVLPGLSEWRRKRHERVALHCK